jgi:hypothetical protein
MLEMRGLKDNPWLRQRVVYGALACECPLCWDSQTINPRNGPNFEQGV